MFKLQNEAFTLVSKNEFEDYTVYTYSCDYFITCYYGGFYITGVTVICDEDNEVTDVRIKHEAAIALYNDNEFEEAISEALGFDVSFTEQGMQEVGTASMELA